MDIIVASSNKHKIIEIEKKCQKFSDINILSMNSLTKIPKIEEDQKTFIGNALKKAKAIHQVAKDVAVLADDSGLSVDALHGEPGVLSARYAGENASDLDRITLLLNNLKDVSAKERTASFVCAIVVILPDGSIFQTEERCHGVITTEIKGINGFGYDPIFYYPPLKKTFAEIDLQEKNEISHRSKALNNVVEFLKIIKANE